MSNGTVRDLFRSLEQTLHERLRFTEDVLTCAMGAAVAEATAAAVPSSAEVKHSLADSGASRRHQQDDLTSGASHYATGAKRHPAAKVRGGGSKRRSQSRRQRPLLLSPRPVSYSKLFGQNK